MKSIFLKEKTIAQHIERKESDTLSYSSDDVVKVEEASTLHNESVSEAEKKLVRKINWILLPMIWIVHFVQIADKGVLSNSVILGMLKDTNMTHDQYSLLGSIFSLGYIITQVPNSYFMQRLPTSKYLGTLVIGWAFITIGSAFVTNFGQMLSCRLLLGICESVTTPCLLITVNGLYRRNEQSSFIGFIWFSRSTGSIVNSLITYAIARTLDGAHGLPAWRWLFLIYGILTLFAGILAIFFLFDDPYSKLLKLTDEERKIVEKRIEDNSTTREKSVKVHHYWESLCEPRYYLIMIASYIGSIPAGGSSLYKAPLIASFGFTALNTILIQIPSSLISIIFLLSTIYLHRRLGKYPLVLIYSYSLAMIGYLLLVVLPHSSIKLLGYFISHGSAGAHALLLAIIANNVNGYSKKIFYNGSYMIAHTLGGFTGPFLMFGREAPYYNTGFTIFIIANLVALLCVLVAIYLMSRINKKRLAAGVTKTDVYLDLTDRENSNFVYIL
ncbi:unnamed protein product [Cunninghamella blakesleeana]